jgi:hypothetical protein
MVAKVDKNMSYPKETDPKKRPMGFEPWLRNPPTGKMPEAKEEDKGLLTRLVEIIRRKKSKVK